MFESCPEAVAWLHDAHFHNTEDRPSPWFCDSPAQVSSEHRRVDLFRNVAHRAARGHRLSSLRPNSEAIDSPDMPVSAPPVSLCRRQLSIVASDKSGEMPICIPLLLSDIVYEAVPPGRISQDGRVAASHLIVIGPRPEGTNIDADQEASDEPYHAEPSPEGVWLLCIGNCDAVGFQRILFELASFGALRWDVDDVYTMTQHSLGKGGCGRVWLGQAKKVVRTPNQKMDKLAVPQVAMKVLKKTQVPMEKSIRTEIQYLAHAHGHPNLSILFGVFCKWKDNDEQSGGYSDGEDVMNSQESFRQLAQPQWYIVMNLCSNGDLSDILDADGAMSQREAVMTVIGVLAALVHLHDLKIVHRDVKAENILLMHDRPVLADMGIASFLSDTEDMKRSVGSPGYAAPEVVRNKPYDEKVDIFSTGVVLYFALSNILPFRGRDLMSVLAKTARCKVALHHEAFQEVSGSILTMMLSLLSKDPTDRPSAQLAHDGLWKIVETQVRSREESRLAPAERPSPPQPPEPVHEPPRLPAEPPQAPTCATPPAPSQAAQSPAPTQSPPSASTQGIPSAPSQAPPPSCQQASSQATSGQQGAAALTPKPPTATRSSSRMMQWARNQFARTFSSGRPAGTASSFSSVGPNAPPQSSPSARTDASAPSADIQTGKASAPTPPAPTPPAQPRPSGSRRPRPRGL
eukprot:TRINITY_DN62693_c0_g1_i1.p1 TRINITY_DN62693_c0_g1~~TRINITY_DN62693_c0_g1_i1.p1  ORF type:complete len:687 (+),score=88.22 TRINITY_DN62693_c0_g1_i1:93-2153(+)